MKKICLNCFKVYGFSRRIPCGNCGSKLVSIDDLYIVIIKILNQKGYTTTYCCSGHTYEKLPQSYILFGEGIKLPFLPEGYVIDHEAHTILETFKDITEIRRDFYSKSYENEVELQKDILKSVLVVLEWAEALPILK
ncbi:hypothetical protein [Clostridium sp.]|uniref:hypothetical protein n=1 Tax=Clostridium sp. TaxID=1506 RepID=UPI003D6CD741